MNWIFELHTFSTLFLTGLIWMVQVVHYPSFHFVGQEQAANFQSFHMRRISYIVMPVMLVEILCAAYMFLFHLDSIYFQFNFLLIALIWINTFFLNVPCHNRLLSEFNNQNIDKLVVSNWPRTILWTFRSIYVLYLF